MADEKIVTSIVANSDFSNLIADVQRVTGSLSKLQQEFAGANRALAGQIAATNAMFSETMRKTGQFSTHFVSLTSDVEKFGRNLDSGRLKLRDYFRVYQEHTRTSGGLIRDLAKQQVQLQNAVLQPLGKNAQGLMQYNVHIPRGLDLTKNKASLLKQELQIMNKVIQDGGVQLINWGKNTQWAGRQLTVGLTLPLAAFGKAAADAFKVADQELTRLTKVYGDIAGTSAQELSKIRNEVSETAKELSSAMGVNFAETISLAADIAATGKTGNELLASVSETTRLAVLGEVDRQEAMKATLAIQSAFKANTDELAESINFLNAVENQTSTTLNDLVEAIPKAGPVIKGLGGDVQDLALYLTAMREGGINASEGANALKSALASLINPTDVAVDKFKGFGIDLLGIVRNNAGDVTATLFALQAALDRLDPLSKQQAIEQLFGKFQFSRLNALFENLGRQGSQTLQVLDLMSASAAELEAVAGRELTAVTESAAGRFKRAVETLRADLAGVGEDFLNIGTKLINALSKIIDFAQKLPDPIKKVLAFGGAFTAIMGPVIMLTGVLANFFGYIIKGVGHFKALFKGAEGFKLLTPEIMAAQHASSLLGDEFYSDAKAADTLRLAIRKLSEDLALLQKNASGATAATSGLGQVMTTSAGTPLSVVGGSGLLRVSDPRHPLIGGQGRAAAHINPRDPNNPASIFGLTFQPEPLNRVIGRTPQILMTERLPGFEGLTEIGGRSTGIVAGEHARYAALMATLGLQSRQEIEQLKKTIRFGGQVSSEFIATFDDILPITTDLSMNAAAQSAAIVSQLKAGKLTVEQAKARIIAVNAELEMMMGQAVTTYGASRGRTIDLTKAPLIDQPVVDASGKPNIRGMFRQGIFRDVMMATGRATRTRTYGGPYSIETTTPSGLIVPGRNMGGPIFYNNGDQVPGPNVNADVVPAMLTPGEFVIRRDVAQQDPDGMRALNEGRAIVVPTFNKGGRIPGVQYANTGLLIRALIQRGSQVGGARARYLGKGSGPSARAISEPNVGSQTYYSLHRTNRTGDAAWNPLVGYGLRRNDPSQGDIILHGASSSFRSRTAHLPRGRSETGIATRADMQGFGVDVSGSSYEQFIPLPNNFVVYRNPNASSWNTSLKKGAKSSEWTGVNGEDMTSLGISLLDAGIDRESASLIMDAAAQKLNNKIRSKSIVTADDFGDYLNEAQLEAVREFFNLPLNRGGRVPGYFGGGGITRRWGKVYGGDELSNTNPLHGPLQIGKFVGPKATRMGRRGQRVLYARPGQSSSVDAFLTGSLEDRGRYVTQEYMLGNYDVLRIPGAIEAMKAWGKKATGTFHRGINLNRSTIGPRPLPDWLTNEIKAAQASGDFSSLIGKEFIMRRSSWSSNPNIAREFGDFSITADVRNRRVTPSSEMFPGIKFVSKADQNKSKAKKLAAARSEEESIFGGKFRIVKADKDGIQIETVTGPLAGNRRFGGQVNAGMPYVVGENGPELFVPKNAGGIIPGYNRGGYATGIQNRMLGGGILRSLIFGSLGSIAGSTLGSRFGQTGSMMGGMLGYMIPDLLMGRASRTGITSAQRLGMPIIPQFTQGPTLEEALAGAPLGQMIPGTGALPRSRQSVFAGTKLAGGIANMAEGPNKFVSIVGRSLAGLTKLNVALGVGAGAVAFAMKKWKDYNETQRLSAAAFGLTADSAEKAGLKFTDYNTKIKDAIAAQKLMIDQNMLTYESLQSAGTPFKMTIEEYKKLRKELKETMAEQVKVINATSRPDAARVAVQLKEQLMAAGLSAEEAAKRIYTLFNLSNKAGMAVSVINTDAFKQIVDAQTAAASALQSFNYAKNFENTRDAASALNTAITAINTGVEDLVAESERAAKKKGEDFDETAARYEAEKKQLEVIASKVKNQATIGEDVLRTIKKQVPEVGKLLQSSDTVVSIFQKLRLVAQGFTGDLSQLNAQQTDAVYKLQAATSQAVETTNREKLLKKQYKDYDALKGQIKDLEKAAKGQSVREQINARDAIRAIDKKIKKIQEEADARKKALRELQQDEDIRLQIQQKQLEYQDLLATGNLSGAAQVQLDIERLVNQQQLTLTERAIDDEMARRISPLEREKERLQNAQEALADKAALAAESLESMYKRLGKQKEAIDAVNTAMTNLKVAMDLNKDDLENFKQSEEFKGLAAKLVDAVRGTGQVVASGSLPDVRQGRLVEDIGQMGLDVLNKYGSDLTTIVAQKGITVTSTGDIVIGGKKVNMSEGQRNIAAPSSAQLQGISRAGSQAALVFDTTTGQWIFTTPSRVTDKMITYEAWQKGKKKYAAGGLLRGPGTGTSDSIVGMYANGGMVRVSNGEYIINADTVSKLGVPFFDRINGMKNGGLMLNYDIPKYGDGGSLIDVAAYNSSSSAKSNNALYNINVTLNGSDMNPDDVARAISREMKMRESMNGRVRTVRS
jgi:TP901 family phage tail tape measure protein